MSPDPPMDAALTADDVRVFCASEAVSWTVLDVWSRSYSPGNRTIDYRKLRHPNGGTYQLVSLDGTLRLMVCDVNSDGLAESQTWDSSGDGIPDRRVVFDPPADMPDWPPDSVR